jgi:sulfite dehydrogenase (quinone) subunit SoeC
VKPSLSIIFFTVSSGAGLGLLALLALAGLCPVELLPAKAIAAGVFVGLALVVAGLAASVLHLAKPSNAWRAMSRFRTSWLSREAVFAAALVPTAAAYGWMVQSGTAVMPRAVLAVAACVLAWMVLVSTAMIYASLKPIRQWHSRWTPVNYVLLGHWSGALFLLLFASAYSVDATAFRWLALALGVAALVAKIGYWRAIADDSNAPTIERAIGVREGARPPGLTVARARLFDAGHSHRTFLTEEFGFALARRHALALRVAAIALGFVAPAAWILSGAGDWRGGLCAVLLCMMGLLAERWLFFAEARHTVRLYHGDAKA